MRARLAAVAFVPRLIAACKQNGAALPDAANTTVSVGDLRALLNSRIAWMDAANALHRPAFEETILNSEGDAI